jgi:hypothetical protein
VVLADEDLGELGLEEVVAQFVGDVRATAWRLVDRVLDDDAGRTGRSTAASSSSVTTC